MFELSGTVEYLFCINCQHNVMVNTTTSGKQFHVYFQSFHSKAKPVECFGPFAHSEPPTVAELEYILDESVIDYHDEIRGLPRLLNNRIDYWAERLHSDYANQLSSLHSNDKYYQSIQDILIDNFHVEVRFWR